MNHRLCPRRTLAWALFKVYGTPEATELIKEQERIAFPLSFESRQYSNSYFCPTIEKVDVRIKEKSCRRRGLWSPRIFIGGVAFENIRWTFVSANGSVYERTAAAVSSLEILSKCFSKPEQMFEENLAVRTRVSTKWSRARKPAL